MALDDFLKKLERLERIDTKDFEGFENRFFRELAEDVAHINEIKDYGELYMQTSELFNSGFNDDDYKFLVEIRESLQPHKAIIAKNRNQRRETGGYYKEYHEWVDVLEELCQYMDKKSSDATVIIAENFEKAYSRLQNWKKVKDIDGLKKLRSNLDYYAELYAENFNVGTLASDKSILFNKTIDDYITKKDERESVAKEIQNFELQCKQMPWHSGNIHMLRKELKEFIGGLLASGIKEKCLTAGYYEGLAMAEELEAKVNSFTSNISVIENESAEVKNYLSLAEKYLVEVEDLMLVEERHHKKGAEIKRHVENKPKRNIAITEYTQLLHEQAEQKAEQLEKRLYAKVKIAELDFGKRIKDFRRQYNDYTSQPRAAQKIAVDDDIAFGEQTLAKYQKLVINPLLGLRLIFDIADMIGVAELLYKEIKEWLDSRKNRKKEKQQAVEELKGNYSALKEKYESVVAGSLEDCIKELPEIKQALKKDVLDKLTQLNCYILEDTAEDARQLYSYTEEMQEHAADAQRARLQIEEDIELIRRRKLDGLTIDKYLELLKKPWQHWVRKHVARYCSILKEGRHEDASILDFPECLLPSEGRTKWLNPQIMASLPIPTSHGLMKLRRHYVKAADDYEWNGALQEMLEHVKKNLRLATSRQDAEWAKSFQEIFIETKNRGPLAKYLLENPADARLAEDFVDEFTCYIEKSCADLAIEPESLRLVFGKNSYSRPYFEKAFEPLKSVDELAKELCVRYERNRGITEILVDVQGLDSSKVEAARQKLAKACDAKVEYLKHAKAFVVETSCRNGSRLESLLSKEYERVEKSKVVFLPEIITGRKPRIKVPDRFLPNLEQIGAYKAQAKTKGKGVRVAIIDTGVDYRHEELKHAYKSGWDFVNNDNNAMDDEGHGTHVAGIIAGRSTGVSPEVELYALKILNSEGVGSVTHLIKAIEWCIDNKIDILNFSLGSLSSSVIEERTIKVALDAGISVVAAAGNEGGNYYSYPASYAGVLSVAAVDGNNQRAWFSNYNDRLGISAPGVDIFSTYLGGGFAVLSGTSMATPHVTAVLAMAKSITGKRGRALEDYVKDKAQSLGKSLYYGNGLVRADKVVEEMLVEAVA